MKNILKLLISLIFLGTLFSCAISGGEDSLSFSASRLSFSSHETLRSLDETSNEVVLQSLSPAILDNLTSLEITRNWDFHTDGSYTFKNIYAGEYKKTSPIKIVLVYIGQYKFANDEKSVVIFNVETSNISIDFAGTVKVDSEKWDESDFSNFTIEKGIDANFFSDPFFQKTLSMNEKDKKK